MLDQKILIFILLLVLFYFVFSYQEHFGGVVDDFNTRLSNLDGRSVKNTDTNYKYVFDDCQKIGKTPYPNIFNKSISCIDNCNNRLVNIDGRCVKNTDTNYKYVSDDCKMIGKEPTPCGDWQQKYKTVNGVSIPNGFEYNGIQCLNKKV
jgi:hypothetical protein